MKQYLYLIIILSFIFLPACSLKAEVSLSANSLIKGSLATVYYYGADGGRYVFPNEKTFRTWYNNFDSVITISNAQLASIPIKGNVTYRPGVKMVKIQTSPKVYAVKRGGRLLWVQTEEVARNLYGENWNKLIEDVPDAFFVNYLEDGAIERATDFNPVTERTAASTIGQDKSITRSATGAPLSIPSASPSTDSSASTETTGNSSTTSAITGKSVFFVHHSTGEIYWDSGMRDALTNHGYTGSAPWWDGDTDPLDFYGEFTDNWSLLDSYNIIIFKSCFPASDITSNSLLENYKTWYRQLYEIYEAHPDKLFVPMSTPPLLRAHTSAAAASRSLEFERWLLNEYKTEYSGNNLAPFALHSLLSDSAGYLHSSYIDSSDDDHPNNATGPVVGDAMWRHLDSVLATATLSSSSPESFTPEVIVSEENETTSEESSTATPVVVAEVSTSNLVQPSDFVYKGAFRLPEGSGGTSWEWGGEAMAYYPEGNTGGPSDGYPGSLFGVGHDWLQYVSEINIPVPVVSPTKNVEDLNIAGTLQGFHDVRNGMFNVEDDFIRAGMEYLPRQGSQTTGKLYFSWGEHFQEYDTSHMWSELNLSAPMSVGEWYLGNYRNYSTNDYMFSIPESWASLYSPGNILGTGRFRDGGQGGQGPSLFAFSPWNDGNPPANGARLNSTPLLLYSTTNWGDTIENKMNNYHNSDDWAGGAWITKANKSAVIFIGTKGTGDRCWYGFSNGVVWPENPPYPEIPENDDRGWWSNSFVGQILFYNPDDLARVARGEMQSYEPQPYATMNIDSYLYNVNSNQQKQHVRAASFDRQRGLLYVFEPLVDNDKPIVHVWQIN